MWESTTVHGPINPKDFGEHLRDGFTNSNGYSYNNIVIKSLRPHMVPCSFTVMAYKRRNPQGKNLYNIGVRANIYNTSRPTVDNIRIFNWVVFDDALFLINKLVELLITECQL
tara:strand:+ start:2290 stop:2628 length:339 start_codon:yes stop_codon:yes gene_type:complete